MYIKYLRETVIHNGAYAYIFIHIYPLFPDTLPPLNNTKQIKSINNHKENSMG